MAETALVVLDTDVWSVLFGQVKVIPEAAAWRRMLTGKRPAIPQPTVAEVLYGAYVADWGPKRLAALEQRLARSIVVPLTYDVAVVNARLRHDCRRTGHPLHSKIHHNDSWIAASAVAHGLPLLARDKVFQNVPGLTLLEDAEDG